MPCTYRAPEVHTGANVLRRLCALKGRTLVVTMEIPWREFRTRVDWHPDTLHWVTDMDEGTLTQIDTELPPCDVVIGVGGGSSCDTAKYLAWKRGCAMVLVPTIVSVDAPFTNMVGVRVANKVHYIGDRYPEEILIDHALIQQAPPEFNRAGACDIASIHTALHDWKLAHRDHGEAYDPRVARLAQDCLNELDRNAEELYNVTVRGIDTLVDLYIREVKFCADLGTSRPEEGSEHIVAYGMEHLTKRHFLHGDLVGLGIFTMSRLQRNNPEWAADLIRRCGLRYSVRDAAREEIRECLAGLKAFKDEAGLFYSVVDTAPIDAGFIEDTLDALYAK